MKIVELIRLEESEQGTFGVLRIDKQVVCCTLEPPDLENRQNRSSIPSQQYLCKPVESTKFGGTFEVTHVPGRSHVLFHAGNVVDSTAGCILLGQHFGKLRGQRAVLNSGATFREFLQQVGRTPFHLTIYEHF